MIQSQWVSLKCARCSRKDNMPLDQYESYELYTCPYANESGQRCRGAMEKIKARTLEFTENSQQSIFQKLT